MFFLFATLWTGPEPAPADEVEVQTLVRAARIGDARAARDLYRLHVAPVYRAVRALCLSDADAEDVTQDAFVDALANLTRYAPREGTRFLGWLITLALNRARKRKGYAARTETASPQQLISVIDSKGSGGMDEVMLARRRALLKALAQIPERDRQVISLFYGAEMSAEEVAAAVRISSANVRKICERQRQKLLNLLEAP